MRRDPFSALPHTTPGTRAAAAAFNGVFFGYGTTQVLATSMAGSH
jgi:hypothetical protein